MSTVESAGPSLTPYLSRVGDVDLLTPEQEVDLAKRARAGVAAASLLTREGLGPARRARLRHAIVEGHRAGDLLVRANLRLVVSMALHYRGRGLDLADLIQDGNLGLIKAVERFDHARGFRFSTYAGWWIRQAITRGLADRGRPLRLPVHVHETLVKLRWVELELWQELQRQPTEEELAARIGLRPGRLREIRAAAGDVASLDAPVGTEGEGTLGATLPDRRAEDPELTTTIRDARAMLKAALSRLDVRERFIVERRYGLADAEPCTLDQIATELGVTRERVRQLEQRALRKLATRHLDDLLGVASA